MTGGLIIDPGGSKLLELNSKGSELERWPMMDENRMLEVEIMEAHAVTNEEAYM